ncbi:hypothetical protein LRY65_02005 [Candidatus Woesebacteria bacterium]|nr:hypothetical protein [Candidatus Woesebacteria bacterium]MCD8507779.1 hypothetical protein [Candidatus Woesebacteria bacterium]MCD8526966.1 hypothetical protein [Candidatus Woesebacteria bacterium]MCD8545863.1 hypothetical protein [Candidatus Woesebacteria bacterium]
MTYETILRDTIFPELEKGRPNWDRPHTEAVVKYLKEIIAQTPELKLDRDVLIIAAYAHDWGYADLFADGKPLNFDQVISRKKEHMRLGAEKLEKLLQKPEFDFLTKEQKKTRRTFSTRTRLFPRYSRTR